MEQFLKVTAGRTYRAGRSLPWGPAQHVVQQLNHTLGEMLIPQTLAVLPLVLLGAPRRRNMLLLGALGLFAVVMCLETWRHPHYAAPGLGLLLVLVCLGARQLACWRLIGPRVGRSIVWSVAILVATSAISSRTDDIAAEEPRWERHRVKLIHALRERPGDHLVIVQYPPGHNGYVEWVYNDADIDRSRIVFARDMGASKNARLLDYFHNRQVWLLTFPTSDGQLEPYPTGGVTP
jgi:hypothetical protein